MALACVLAVPLALVLVLAYAALAGEKPAEPQVALGSSGGAFHPVAGNFRPDDTVVDDCGDEEYSCRQQAFGNIAFRQGAKAALALFEEQITSNELVRADCHRIGHVIGSAAYARYEGNVAKTFALGSSTCASGYYHGILERAFVGVNTKTKLVDVARSPLRRKWGAPPRVPRLPVPARARARTDDPDRVRPSSCPVHLPLALSTCARLETGWDDVVCTGGAFMENVTTRFGFRSSWLSDDDPLDPCGRIPLRNRRSCYLRAAVRVISFHDNDFAKAAETCAALDPRWAEPCFRGFGRDAVGAARYAPAKIISLCRFAGEWQGDCLFGAARTVGDGFGVPGARRAAKLCRRAPEADRDSCFSGVGIIVGLLYPTDVTRRAACTKIAVDYASACATTAIAEVRPDGREAWG